MSCGICGKPGASYPIEKGQLNGHQLVLQVKTPSNPLSCQKCVDLNEKELKKLTKKQKEEEKKREKKEQKERKKLSRKEKKTKKETGEPGGGVVYQPAVNQGQEFNGSDSGKSFFQHTNSIMMIGDSYSGKTSLVLKLIQNTFIPKYDKTLSETYEKRMKVDDEETLVEIVDVGGTPEQSFSPLNIPSILRCVGFVFVYSINSRQSFVNLESLIKEVIKIKQSTRLPSVVMANKLDLKAHRQVTEEEGVNLAKKFECAAFVETSAKSIDRTPVMEGFFEVIREIRDRDR